MWAGSRPSRLKKKNRNPPTRKTVGIPQGSVILGNATAHAALGPPGPTRVVVWGMSPEHVFSRAAHHRVDPNRLLRSRPGANAMSATAPPPAFRYLSAISAIRAFTNFRTRVAGKGLST